MLKKVLLAAVATLACASAHADGPPGHWVDVRNQMSLENMPEGSEPVARLGYAKDACNSRGTTAATADVYHVCMRARGFVFVVDSQAQIVARQKAASDAEWRAAGSIVSQAVGQLTTAITNPPPTRCLPHVLQMNCY